MLLHDFKETNSKPRRVSIRRLCWHETVDGERLHRHAWVSRRLVHGWYVDMLTGRWHYFADMRSLVDALRRHNIQPSRIMAD